MADGVGWARRAAWSVLVGLAFGAPVFPLVGWLVSTYSAYGPVPTLLGFVDLWAGLVLAGTASWILIAERGAGPTRERAMLAGATIPVATPWLWGLAFLALATAGWTPPSFGFTREEPFLSTLGMVVFGVWGSLGVPAVLVGAVVGAGFGRIRRAYSAPDEQWPAAIVATLVRRTPLVPRGRRQWVALGATTYLAGGMVAAFVPFREYLTGTELAVTVASAGVAAAASGWLATRVVTAGEASLRRTVPAGAVAGLLTAPLAAGPVLVATAVLGKEVFGAGAVLLATDAGGLLLLLQYGSLTGGVLSVALGAAYRRTGVDTRSTSDATPAGGRGDPGP